MKRDRELEDDEGQQDQSAASMAAPGAGAASSSSAGKEKVTWSEEPESGGMDELLEALGYKVRSSDMADVAQKLEQLEMAMGTTMEDGISQLSETTHYNPSDLSSWVESMLSEINNTAIDPPNTFDPVVLPGESSGTMIDFSNNKEIGPQDGGMVFNDGSQYDLRAIPGGAIFGADSEPGLKRTKTMPTGSNLSIQPAGVNAFAGPSNVLEPVRPMVVVDSQETGIRLVHTLMACADAVQQDDLKLADALVNHIAVLATSQAGAMRKVATYFAQALARRIYKGMLSDSIDPSYLEILQMHFYESCPYLKFAHFTANQAILEAFAGANHVHVIDFSLKQGMQWPALMQALALRPGGPPSFRLTGIGPPQPDNTDALQQVGWKLAQLAEAIGVEFEFRGFVANSLADLDAAILEIRPSEVESVAVNSVFELHPLLARPGGIERVLASIKAMNPKIVTVVEQEANHNGPVFVDRFNEALHYYSTMFDSLESSVLTHRNNSQDLLMTEVYLGRQIANVVACEGPERVERHETLAQWRVRMNSAGFDPVHIGSNAFKQASMLLALFAGGVGYMVEENDGCLMLGWHTRPLIATSAWQLAPGDP